MQNYHGLGRMFPPIFNTIDFCIPPKMVNFTA